MGLLLACPLMHKKGREVNLMAMYLEGHLGNTWT